MKKCYPFIFFALLLFNCPGAFAQQAEQPVRFLNGNFITGSNISLQKFKQEDLQSALYGIDYFVLVQFTDLPSPQTREHLKNAGLMLEGYLPGKAYYATIKNNFDFTTLKHYGVAAVNPLPAVYKIDRSVYSFTPVTEKETIRLFAVSFYAGAGKENVLRALQGSGAAIVTTRFNMSDVIFIQPDIAVVNAIAAFPFVRSISLQPLTDRIMNYKSGPMHGMAALLSPAGRRLSGRNITVGMGDNAEISTHVDFTGRVINRVYALPAFHGIHTSGTVAGAGIIDPKNHGMAPSATIVSQWFSDIILNTPTYVTD